MKRFSAFLIASSLFVVAAGTALAQEKRGQTGFEFLSVGTDARATAMGEAHTTLDGSSLGLFYNPAAMGTMTQRLDFRASRMEWIADINYISGSLALNFAGGRYGVFGVSFLSVDYGELLGTVVSNNEQGFEETGAFSPSAFLVGLGYAKQLSDRFTVGGQAKLVYQSLGDPVVPTSDTTRANIDLTQDVIAFDFGTIYKTGFKSFTFGMTVRNFSSELQYAQESFQLPLTFKIGFSIDMFDFWASRPESQSFLLAVDAVNPRSFPEYVTLGGEYTYLDMLSLRAGYVASQDEYSLTYGFGIRKFGIAIDYSYTPYDVFKDVNRFSFSVSF